MSQQHPLIDKKKLLEYLATLQAQKRAGRDVQQEEAELKRELIKILIEEKRKNIAEKIDDSGQTRITTYEPSVDCTPLSPQKQVEVEREEVSVSLPKAGNELPFFDRAVRWKEAKEAVSARAREESVDSELSACTFQPSINTNKSYKSPATPVVARLYSDSKSKLREWEHEKKRKEEEEIQRTCTFKPQTNTRHPTPKRSITNPHAKQSGKENSPRFSFSPTINKIPTQMATASQYLAMNAFERLSRATIKPNALPNSSTGTAPHTTTQPARPRPSSAPPGGRDISTSPTNASFNTFIARQQDHLTKKQRKIECIVRNESTPAQPTLCSRSKQIIKQKQVGGFLERLAQDAQKAKPSKAPTGDTECTFQPKILPSSKIRKPRSVEELSIGDKLKHDARLEEMRQKVDDEEARQATFKPATTNYPTQSRLKIMTDPDTYLERLQKEQEMKEELHIEWQQQQEKIALEKCTFQPEIHDAPRYVKRIARSMALARGNKPRTSVSPPKKPEWL